MADKSSAKNDDLARRQEAVDKLYAQKVDKFQHLKGSRMLSLKRRNNMLGLLLAGGVLGIYGYTIFAMRQTKMMEAFDKTPE